MGGGADAVRKVLAALHALGPFRGAACRGCRRGCGLGGFTAADGAHGRVASGHAEAGLRAIGEAGFHAFGGARHGALQWRDGRRACGAGNAAQLDAPDALAALIATPQTVPTGGPA